MSKTKIGGTRIRNQAIGFEHLSPLLKIPESMIELIYPSHFHPNKNTLDKVRYTGTKENVDLRDIELLLLEVVSARRNGKNLGGTIDDKADRGTLQAITDEISAARGQYGTLTESIRQYGTEVDNKLSNHIGAIGHSELDSMYSDFLAAKNGEISLTERLRLMSVSSGGGGTGGTVTIETLNPWTYRHTVSKDINGEIIRTIDIPHTFTPNANTIQVFDGPLLMMAGSTHDYVEVDSNTIEFNYDLPEGTVVTIQGVSNGTLFYWTQVFRTNANQTYFRVLDSYNVGRNEIVVYESGLLMTPGVDYLETGDNSISFIDPLPEGVQVVISRRR